MIRLAIADDAPFIREIVRTIAEKNGLVLVGEAADGNEAIELALRERPEFFLMDIIMPNKSGIEAAREILAQIPTMKIVAFSTADQDVMVSRALEAGCCSFLVKPFKADDLLKVLQG